MGFRLPLVRFVLALPVAWVAGNAVFWALSGGPASEGDATFVALWSALALALCAPIFYYAFGVVRRTLGGDRPLIVFPIVGAVLGLIPSALLSFHFGGGFRQLLYPSQLLTHCLFGVVGLVLGFAFAFPSRPVDG